MVAGLGNKAIAEEMSIGEQAVKAHISRLFLKFRVENRAGLAVAAMSQDLDARSLAVRELERLAREEHRDAIRARSKLLTSLIGKGPASVVARDGRILLANPAFQRTFLTALRQDENGVRMPADATPLLRATNGKPGSLRFKLASGPRKGTWWRAKSEAVSLGKARTVAIVLFRSVRGPR